MTDRPVPATTADTATAAAGQPVTITYEGDGGQPTIRQIICGYSSSEEAVDGLLTITSAGETIFRVPITAPGAAPIVLEPPLSGDAGEDLAITLSGETGLIGYLNVRRVS